MKTEESNRIPLILVVDDELTIRRLVRSILERSGHQVVEASLAEEALNLLKAKTPPPDLLLTDIVMPGMNGITLAAKAHKIVPGLPVLFMTGFAQDYSELAGPVCVSKPFKAAELLAAVQSALPPLPPMPI